MLPGVIARNREYRQHHRGKRMIRIRPSQKFGTACAETASQSAKRSIQVLRFSAASAPSGMAIAMVTNECGKGKGQGRADTLCDQRCDRLVPIVAYAEIAAQHACEPVSVAHPKGPVEAETLAYLLDHLRVSILAGNGVGRIGGDVEEHEGRKRDRECDGNGERGALRNVRQHRTTSSKTGRRGAGMSI